MGGYSLRAVLLYRDINYATAYSNLLVSILLHKKYIFSHNITEARIYRVEVFNTVERVNMEGLRSTTDIEQHIADKIDELKYVDGINGERFEVKELAKESHIKLQEVCGKVDVMGSDIVEIKQATEIFIDFSKIYRILKKYRKIRWSTSLMSVGIFVYGVFFR